MPLAPWLGAAGVAALLALLEWRRPGPARTGRMLAAGVLPLALLALLLPPAVHRAATAPGAGARTATPPTGIVRADWPRTLPLGTALDVRVQVRAREGRWLRLRGIAGEADSARLGRDTTVTLTLLPRATGDWVYRLWVDGDGAPDTAAVGVTVTPPPPLTVLVALGRPSFELRFLRDWLAARGFGVASRVVTSRDVVREEFTATPRRRLAPLDRALLDSLVAVVLDGTQLQRLSAAERTALGAWVKAGGTALLLADAPGALPAPFGFALSAYGELGARELRPRAAARTAPLGTVVAHPLVVDGGVALVRDAGSGVLAAARPVGIGHAVVTVIATPSRWALAGLDGDADWYWSTLLTGFVSPPAPRGWRVVTEGAALVDAPVELEGDSGAARLVARAPDGSADTLAARDDEPFPMLTWWPRQAGWHRFEDPTGAVTSVHVTPAAAWPGIVAARRATREAWATVRGAAPAALPGAAAPPATRWPWFLLVLVSAGLLWWWRAQR